MDADAGLEAYFQENGVMEEQITINETNLKTVSDNLERAHVNLSNYNNFVLTVEKLLPSIRTAIDQNVAKIRKIRDHVKKIKSMPELKDTTFESDPWKDLCDRYEDVVELLLENNAWNVWRVNFLTIEVDKLKQAIKEIKEDYDSVAKLKAEQSLMATSTTQIKGIYEEVIKTFKEMNADSRKDMLEQLKQERQRTDSYLGLMKKKIESIEESMVYSCDKCGEDFRNKPDYEKHMKEHEDREKNLKDFMPPVQQLEQSELTGEESRILEAIRQTPEKNKKFYENISGISNTNAIIDKLVAKKKIVEIKSGNTNVYKVSGGEEPRKVEPVQLLQ